MVQEQLATIIQRIQMENRNGLLLVKRGEGSNLEEGTILFVNGKMEDARAGRRTKFDAFKYLCTWEHYEFSFRTPDGKSLLFSSPPSFSSTTREYKALHTPLSPLTPPTPLQLNPLAVRRPAEELVPYHSRNQLSEALVVIEKMGLSRGHRRLFLLINGERSVSELARLTASAEDEVYQRLQDLEKAAVVHMT